MNQVVQAAIKGLLLPLALFVQSGEAGGASAFTLATCTGLPVPTQMHGSAVVGKRLYVFGGSTPEGFTNQVRSAEILDNGTLGRWTDETPLPDRRHYIGGAVEVVNNRIYVAGGAVADTADMPEGQVRMCQDLLWTEVLADGSLAPWRVADPFPGGARANLSTCSTSRHLYILGGRAKDLVSNQAYMADFAPDGAPRNWRSAGWLPFGLWFGGAAILENRMYIWGGLTDHKPDSASSRVLSAEVKPDGTLGEWREETPMPERIYSAANCGFNDYLICVAGRLPNARPFPDILFARLENGHVGPWQRLSSNLQARVFHSLGLDRTLGRLYITGGQHRAPTVLRGGDVLTTVQGFELGAPSAASPPPGLVDSHSATSGGVRDSLSRSRSVLLYFRSPLVPAVRRFEESVMTTPEFRQLTRGHELKAIDASRDQSLCYEYSVFQVPALVLVTPDGQVRRSGVLRSLDDVRKFLAEPR